MVSIAMSVAVRIAPPKRPSQALQRRETAILFFSLLVVSYLNYIIIINCIINYIIREN